MPAPEFASNSYAAMAKPTINDTSDLFSFECLNSNSTKKESVAHIWGNSDNFKDPFEVIEQKSFANPKELNILDNSSQKALLGECDRLDVGLWTLDPQNITELNNSQIKTPEEECEGESCNNAFEPWCEDLDEHFNANIYQSDIPCENQYQFKKQENEDNSKSQLDYEKYQLWNRQLKPFTEKKELDYLQNIPVSYSGQDAQSCNLQVLKALDACIQDYRIPDFSDFRDGAHKAYVQESQVEECLDSIPQLRANLNFDLFLSCMDKIMASDPRTASLLIKSLNSQLLGDLCKLEISEEFRRSIDIKNQSWNPFISYCKQNFKMPTELLDIGNKSRVNLMQPTYERPSIITSADRECDLHCIVSTPSASSPGSGKSQLIMGYMNNLLALSKKQNPIVHNEALQKREDYMIDMRGLGPEMPKQYYHISPQEDGNVPLQAVMLYKGPSIAFPSPLKTPTGFVTQLQSSNNWKIWPDPNQVTHDQVSISDQKDITPTEEAQYPAINPENVKKPRNIDWRDILEHQNSVK